MCDTEPEILTPKEEFRIVIEELNTVGVLTGACFQDASQLSEKFDKELMHLCNEARDACFRVVQHIRNKKGV